MQTIGLIRKALLLRKENASGWSQVLPSLDANPFLFATRHFNLQISKSFLRHGLEKGYTENTVYVAVLIYFSLQPWLKSNPL